jgi:ATP adenylyltransferase
MKRYLFNAEKIKYVTGKKPDVECILCALRDGHAEVPRLEVYRTELMMISVNRYPFNPGHLMIFPLRHVEEYEELTDEEALELFHLTARTISILRDEFHPDGFNIGFNLGRGSGASIAHLHQHIVPRFGDEVGFLDVLAGTRVFVVDPAVVMKRLRKRFLKK